MKRTTLALLLGIMLTTSLSCNKKDNVLKAEANSWTLGEVFYAAQQVLFFNTPGSYYFYATSKFGNATNTTLFFNFSNDPGSSGQFLITDTNSPNTISIKITEYADSSGIPSAAYYNKQTSVKLNFSKNTTSSSSISFPSKIWMYKVGSRDSVLFSITTLTSP